MAGNLAVFVEDWAIGSVVWPEGRSDNQVGAALFAFQARHSGERNLRKDEAAW